MDFTIGDVRPAGGTMFHVMVRGHGIFVRPSDGALVDRDAREAMPFRPAEGDESHLIVMPEGTLGVTVQEGQATQIVLRLPGGSLVTAQETRVKINAKEMKDGELATSKDLTKDSEHEITSLDEVRRLVEALENASEPLVDVGRTTHFALVSPAPGNLNVRPFPHVVKVGLVGMEFDFAYFQAFTLPLGTMAARVPGRMVARVSGRPLVLTEVAPAYARWALHRMFTPIAENLPPQLIPHWNLNVPALLDDYGAVLDRLAPITSVWCAAAVQEAWTRLDAAAAGP